MLTLILLIFIILAFGGLFYRPLGSGYSGYLPSLLFTLIVFILLLYLLGVL